MWTKKLGSLSRRSSERPAGDGGRSRAVEAPDEGLPTALAEGQDEGRSGLARVGVLWTGRGLDVPTAPFLASGQHVAAAAWIRAMASHRTVPYLDLFVPVGGEANCQRLLQGVPLRQADEPGPGARVLSESSIPEWFRSNGYDALHVPLGLCFDRTSYLRSRFSAGRVFPITCSQHGCSYSLDLYPAYVSTLTSLVYPCDAIVCLTQSARSALRNRLEDIAERYSSAWERPAPPLPRLELIPWGVDAERFGPRDQAVARHDLDLPLDRPIVLCIGRVQIQDKMDWTPLLLAFERVCRVVDGQPILVLAGSCGSEYGQLLLTQAAHMGLSGRLRAFFNLPPACLPSLYAACDVFVSPSDSPSESFGLTVLEAMACGRAVVASDWDGYKELIVHGETGFRVRTRWADCLGQADLWSPFMHEDYTHLAAGQTVSVDIPEMADYLVDLLRNRDLRERMGRHGRARVEAHYNWSAVLPQWEALWTELAMIARSVDIERRDALDYLRPNYFRQFCHYASEIVEETAGVRLSERGEAVLAGHAQLYMHPWSQGFLRPAYMLATLSRLKSAGRIGAEVQVGDLLRLLAKAHGLNGQEGLMHLMWLSKYDLVELGGAGAADHVGEP